MSETWVAENTTGSCFRSLPQTTLNIPTSVFFFLQDPEILEAQSNIILTAIVNGMKKDETRLVQHILSLPDSNYMC